MIRKHVGRQLVVKAVALRCKVHLLAGLWCGGQCVQEPPTPAPFPPPTPTRAQAHKQPVTGGTLPCVGIY